MWRNRLQPQWRRNISIISTVHTFLSTFLPNVMTLCNDSKGVLFYSILAGGVLTFFFPFRRRLLQSVTHHFIYCSSYTHEAITQKQAQSEFICFFHHSNLYALKQTKAVFSLCLFIRATHSNTLNSLHIVHVKILFFNYWTLLLLLTWFDFIKHLSDLRPWVSNFSFPSIYLFLEDVSPQSCHVF